MKRYVSIDILKGFSMFLVLTFHVLTRTLDMDIIDAALHEFSIINIPLYIIIILLGYIGQFDIVYICISAFGNIFSVQKQWDREITKESTSDDKKALSKKIMKTQLIRGSFIAFLGYFSEWILNGMIVDLVTQNEQWTTNSIGALFFAQILTVMAINNVILSFIYLICLRNDKWHQIPVILFFLFIGFIILTPGIIEVLNINPMVWTTLQQSWKDRTVGMNIAMFFLTPFVRRHTPIFPNFSASALGALIAFKFSQEGIQKKFLNWLVLCSIVLQLAGVCFAYFERQGYSRIQLYGLGPFLFAFSGSILFILFFVYFFEVRGTATTIKYSKFWRRFGLFTLTIWCMQWVIIFPALLVQVVMNLISGTWTKFLDSPLVNNGLNIWQFAIALLFITGFYFGILWLWEKIHFIGTFEWMTVQLISGSYKNAKSRLNLDQSLYNVESYIPERMNLYKWWQLTLVFFLFIGFAFINGFFYLL